MTTPDASCTPVVQEISAPVYQEAAKTEEKIVIGISGVSRSGKGWVSKGLLQALEAIGKKVTIIGQDEFWFQACQVKVRGEIRTSEEEAECTDHANFAAVIEENMSTHDVVIAEGFQLVYDPRVTALLNQIFLIDLDRDEARRRRTQPRDATVNPNPLRPEDFDDLLWPAHERYMKDKVAPLGTRVVQLQSPTNPPQRDELVNRIMHATGLKNPLPARQESNAERRTSRLRRRSAAASGQEAMLMLAALLMDRGRLVEARQRFTTLHEADFGNPMYRFFLGLCLFLSDEGQASKALFETSGKPREWFAGLSDQAAVAAKLKASPGPQDVVAFAACVEKLLEFGLPQLVFTFLDQTSTLSQEILDREPMARLDARASAMEMDYSAALARLDRLIAGGQASRDAYRLAGDCHYHLQDYDRALQMMNKAMSFDEPLDDAAFHARLGHVLLQKKRWKQAREAFLRSISLAPTAEAWYGVSYAEYRSEEFKTCYEALCEAELLDNERPDVWAQLTLVHLRLENWENADRCFAQCRACDPDCDELLLEVSAEYVKRETKPALAEAAARCALKVRDSGQGHAALADSLALSGQTEPAVAESQCAIRLLVDSPEQRKAIFERASRWCEELDPSFADELDSTRRQVDQQFMQRVAAGDHH